MARLQKKKDTGSKKKVKTQSEHISESGIDSSDKNLSTKLAVSSGYKKPMTEKPSDDIKKGEPNFIQRSIDFFREVKVELKKVTWPTRKQTTGTTIVVIVFVIVVSIFLGIFDYALSKLVQVVLT